MTKKSAPVLGLEALLNESKLFGQTVMKPLVKLIDKCFAFEKINHYVSGIAPKAHQGASCFMADANQYFSLNAEGIPAFVDRIPETGPIIIVANHPTGLAETIILTSAILTKRPDLKILANSSLARIPALSDILLPVNVFNQQGHANVSTIKAAQNSLAANAPLLIFPAAEIADYQRGANITKERAWSRLPIKLAMKTDANILSVHITGKNSPAFYLMGLLHSHLRTLMIARELLNKKHVHFHVTTSQVFSLNKLNVTSQKRATQLLFWLNQALPELNELRNGNQPFPHSAQTPLPLATLPDVAAVQAEVDQLQANQLLHQFKHIAVYNVTAKQIPALLQVIQIKREETFRQVKMGSNKAIDKESYDEHAQHLFVWDKKTNVLVGGYRYKIINQPGLPSYINQFYDVNWSSLLKEGHLVELSRSFVTETYQKSFSSLLSLWRGLGQAILREKKCNLITGVVSIPAHESSSLLLAMLAQYIQRFQTEQAYLARCFKAKNPYQPTQPLPHSVKQAILSCDNFSQLAFLYNQITGESFEFPEFFKLYEKLGTVPIAVSVDPDFSDCIDVLQIWDMRGNINESQRFIFGKDGVETLKALHPKR